jgi:membrane fusion protein, multidrug efflux system
MSEFTHSPLLRSRVAALVSALLLVAALGAGVLHWRSQARQAAPPGEAAPPPVPVSVATAKREDVPVYLYGIGSAQPLNTVAVRARVDGTLTRFAVTEGQEVKQNELIAVIDPRPYQAALDAAMAKKAQDEAQLANSRQDLARYDTLAKKEFASRQQVDTQQASVGQFTAAVKGDEAAIETAQLNLSFCYVLAPIDGRIGLRQVDPGNLVHAADATGIVSITQIRPISVVFTLPQAALPQVSAAMKERKLEATALGADDKSVLDTGELLTLDNTVDQGTGTIRLKAIFPNANNALWPGQFVEVRLHVDTHPNALTVPSPAVQHGPSGLYAYVVGDKGTVSRKDVTVGQDDGTRAVLEQGVGEGDTVVVNGQSRLQSGTRVAVKDGG